LADDIENTRQYGHGEARNNTNLQRAFKPVLRTQAFHQIMITAYDIARALDKSFAFRRQIDVAGIAVEEPEPQFLLHRADTIGYRRRGHIEASRRRPEITQFRQPDHRFQKTDIHGRACPFPFQSPARLRFLKSLIALRAIRFVLSF